MWRYILLLSIMVLLLSSCQKQGIEKYDVDQSFIYFEKSVFNIGNTVDDPDSLQFSFAYEDDSLQEKILSFPIQLVGQRDAHDRSVGFRIIKEQTTLPDSLYRVVPPVIRSNYFQDTLFIRLKRSPVLKKVSYQLAGELYQNEAFDLAASSRSSIHLSITDQLSEPYWWSDWSSFFGAYRKEVYKKWIEIYYPGADLTPPVRPEDKPHYAWNNMPDFFYRNYYPLTLFYIGQLQQYFRDHAVYPDDDPNRPRIYVP
ncbi:DUF4843 domain-containing protein [Olivibacter sp. CPCC 100613]|uniref:DUF4843 domain-containing protein n=1 Tax=Olivibacter sp. CPCC 100613 TaxID=3079931 RepID=UPI002FF65FAE